MSSEDNEELRQLLVEMEEALAGRWEAVNEALRQHEEHAETIHNYSQLIKWRLNRIERAHNDAAFRLARHKADHAALTELSERAKIVLPLSIQDSPLPDLNLTGLSDAEAIMASLREAAVPILTREAVVGVYFLLDDDEVVYVGQSTNALGRALEHATDGAKKFNRWCYIRVNRCDLDSIERFFIRLLLPRHNIAHKPRTAALPSGTHYAES